MPDAQPGAPHREEGPTCVTHEVVVRGIEEAMKATGVVSRAWVAAELVLRGRVGVTAQVSGFKGGLGFHAGVAA